MQTNKDFHLAGKKLMIGLPAYDHKVTVSMAVSLDETQPDGVAARD
jgi:hypothetical protein